jgi:hypothetical protein
MVKPKIEVKEYKQRVIGSIKQKYLNVKKKQGNNYADFEIEELHNILESIEDKAKKAGKEIKIIMRGLCPTGWRTLKAFDTELDIDEYDDYFDARVKSTSKFKKIAQLDIIVTFEI